MSAQWPDAEAASGSLAEFSASELAAERLLALCADLARSLVPRESARLAVDLDFGRELEPLLFVRVAVLLRDPGRVRSERSVTVDVDVDVVRKAVAFDLTGKQLPVLAESHAGDGAVIDQLVHVRRRLDHCGLRLAVDLALVAGAPSEPGRLLLEF